MSNGRRRNLKSGLLGAAALILVARAAYSLGLPESAEIKLEQLGKDSAFVSRVLDMELPSEMTVKFEQAVKAAENEEAESEQTAKDNKELFLKHMSISDIDGSSREKARQEREKAGAALNIQQEQAHAVQNNVTLTSGSIDNRTGIDLDLDTITAQMPEIDMSIEGPKVLIYHTHASEAYTPDGSDIYVESDPSRTEDCDYNMVRVGREIASVLEANGIETVQAETLHDYPSYSGSYARSLETVQDYLEQYPSIQVVLDIHRDALEKDDGTVLSTVADSGVAEDTAQLLIVVGTDEGGLEHPNWQQNLCFGMSLQQRLEKNCPTLARPISIRSSRFNQHTSPCALLVEIGCSGNTLSQALNCADLFAENLAGMLLEE